jgi:hypothetical protein
MTANHWAQRVTGTTAPHELQEVRSAARNLAQEAGLIPGRTGLVFQTVTHVALLSTAVITGALALAHLWKALSRPAVAHRPDRQPGHHDSESPPPTRRMRPHDPADHGR